jgi:hypothetical protein
VALEADGKEARVEPARDRVHAIDAEAAAAQNLSLSCKRARVERASVGDILIPVGVLRPEVCWVEAALASYQVPLARWWPMVPSGLARRSGPRPRCARPDPTRVIRWVPVPSAQRLRVRGGSDLLRPARARRLVRKLALPHAAPFRNLTRAAVALTIRPGRYTPPRGVA